LIYCNPEFIFNQRLIYDNYDMNKLGDRIKYAINAAGTNPNQIHTAIGSPSVQAIGKWAKTGKISLDSLHALANHLRVPMEWFYSDDDYETGLIAWQALNDVIRAIDEIAGELGAANDIDMLGSIAKKLADNTDDATFKSAASIINQRIKEKYSK